jgi:hypothetical protein
MAKSGAPLQAYCEQLLMLVMLRYITDDIDAVRMDGNRRLFLEKGSFVRKQFDAALDRRDVFRAALAAIAASATGGVTAEPAVAAPTGGADKRRARYQAHSAEVENFYRVNRYPAQ